MADTHDERVELILPPNQYVNLIFPLNNATYEYEKGIVDKPQIEGISLKDTSLTYSTKTKSIGVRFYAFGIYPFIHVEGKQIVNKSIDCPLASEKTKGITEAPAKESVQFIVTLTI